MRRYQLDISSDVCQDTCSPLDCSCAVCPGGTKQWQGRVLVWGCEAVPCAPAGECGTAGCGWALGLGHLHPTGVKSWISPDGPLRNGGSPTPPGPAWNSDVMGRQLYWNCWYQREFLAFAGAWRLQTICMAVYLFSGMAAAWPRTLTKKPQCLKL